MKTLDKYRLYRGETACDTDDWGPPVGEYPTLLDAMRAAGVPLSCWRTDPHCPDETFTLEGITSTWSILAPGAAAETEAMYRAARDAKSASQLV